MSFQWAERAKVASAGGEGQGEQKKVEKQTQLKDIVEEVERHARILGRKEELEG